MGMSFIETENCFASSQVWQAFFGIGALDQCWRSIYVDLPPHLLIENKKTALDNARLLIARHYGIPDLELSETIRKVDNVLSNKPFLVHMLS
jgi:hypothetical protein